MKKETKEYNKVVRNLSYDVKWDEVLKHPLHRLTGKSLAMVFVFLGTVMQSPQQKAYVYARADHLNHRGKSDHYLILSDYQRVHYFWALVEEVIAKQGLVGFTVNKSKNTLVYNPIGKVEVSTQTLYTVLD